jgi:D-serine deaminase-like pyridoxal phosphate-dependent protein
VLYGVPPGIDRLGELRSLSDKLYANGATLRLMIDHPGQIEALADVPLPGQRSWSIFIKVDGGGRRAGLPPNSSGMRELIRVAIASPYVDIYGFYSHFGRECFLCLSDCRIVRISGPGPGAGFPER